MRWGDEGPSPGPGPEGPEPAGGFWANTEGSARVPASRDSANLDRVCIPLLCAFFSVAASLAASGCRAGPALENKKIFQYAEPLLLIPSRPLNSSQTQQGNRTGRRAPGQKTGKRAQAFRSPECTGAAAPRGIGEEGAANRRRRAAGGQAPSWCASDPATAGPDRTKAIGTPNPLGQVGAAITSWRVVWQEDRGRVDAEEPGNVQKFAGGAADFFP